MTTLEKIDDVIQKCGSLSTNSRDNQNIIPILSDLGDLLNEFEDKTIGYLNREFGNCFVKYCMVCRILKILGSRLVGSFLYYSLEI